MMFLSVAVALVAGDVHLEGSASAQLLTRARTPTTSDTAGTQAAGDAEIMPILMGALENLGGRIQLMYMPMFREREPYAHDAAGRYFQRSEFNQLQTLSAEWRREGHARPYLTESFYYGFVDLGVAQAAGAPATVAAPIQAGTLKEERVDVNGGVQWPIGRLTSLDTSVGFNFGGGADFESRQRLFMQHSWRTRFRFETQLTAVDTVIAEVLGQYSIFPGRFQEFQDGAAALRYRRQLISWFAIEAGLLGGMIVSTQPVTPLDNQPTNRPLDTTTATRVNGVPGGDVTLLTRLNHGAHVLGLDLGARVAPFIDRYVPTAYDRGEIFTTLTYVFQERWQAAWRGGVSKSLTPATLADGSQAQILTTFFEARVGYAAPRFWRVDLAGVNSTFVLGTGAPVNNWLVSLSLTLHAEGQL